MRQRSFDRPRMRKRYKCSSGTYVAGFEGEEASYFPGGKWLPKWRLMGMVVEYRFAHMILTSGFYV